VTFAGLNLGEVKPRTGDAFAELEALRHRPWRLGSASQVAWFRSCPRKWWLKHIGGLVTPETEQQARGRRVQVSLEQRLWGERWDRVDDDGILEARELALAGHAALVARYGRRAWRTSYRGVLHNPDWPVPVVAELDLDAMAAPSCPGEGLIDDEATPHGDRNVIVDLKTSASKRPMPAAPTEDPQAILYSSLVMDSTASRIHPPVHLFGHTYMPRLIDVTGETYSERPVTFAWLNVRTQPVGAAIHEVEMTLDARVEGCVAITGDLDAMRRTSLITSPASVPANRGACYEHGPCPFLAHCAHLTPSGESMSSPIASPFKKKAVSDLNTSTRAEMSPETAPATTPTPTPPADLPEPPLQAIEKLAKQAKDVMGFNRNAARPTVIAAEYPGYRSPAAESVEVALRNVYGSYINPGDAEYALSVYRQKGVRFIWTPEKWLAFFDRAADKLVPLPTLHDIACFIFDGAARATEAGYPFVPPATVGQTPTETLPAMSSEQKAEEMAPKRPKAPKELIPNHPAVPERWRGQERSQIQLQLATEIRNELAVAAIQAGHTQVPTGAPSLLRLRLLDEIACILEVMTGALPWTPAERPAWTETPAPTITTPEASPEVATPAEATAEALPVDPPQDPPTTPASSPTPVGPGPRLLFVDCQPRGGDYVELGEWLQDVYRWIEREKGVAHWSMLPFGDGQRLAAAGLNYGLTQGSMTLPERLVVRRSYPGASDALAELVRHYSRDQVIEATR
jgi:hypothetical protein